MIELSKPIQLSNGVIVPAGVRLEFKNDIAKYNKYPVNRALIPLEAIKGAKGPFLNAFCATLLNENRGFQNVYKKQFKDWAHCVLWEDYLIVYIWDTRQVIDVIAGMHSACKGGPITRTLVNKQTGEELKQTLGYNKFGWAKSLYEMSMWPVYHRPDNGMPLVCKELGWKPIIDKFNAPIRAQFAYENFDESKRVEYAEKGLAMPDGSYPITDKEDLKNAIQAIGRAKDYDAVKAFIIKRAKELDAIDELPESWGIATESDETVISPARPRQNTANFVLPYDLELAKVASKLGAGPTNADPRLRAVVSKKNGKQTIMTYFWQTMQPCCKAIDLSEDFVSNNIDALSSDRAIGKLEKHELYAMQEKSCPNCYDDCCNGCASEAAVIVPAAVPNKHSIVIDDIEVASIMAKKLVQIGEGFDKDAEGNQTDEYKANANVTPAYKNTDDNKLVVKDNAGNILKLKCLDDDIVLADDIIKEVTEQLGAAENLSQDLFKDYDNATGKQYVHDIKVIYVNDLWQLCQMLDGPAVEFRKDKQAMLSTADYSVSFDFDKDEVSYDNDVPNKVKTFINSHFGRNMHIV